MWSLWSAIMKILEVCYFSLCDSTLDVLIYKSCETLQLNELSRFGCVQEECYSSRSWSYTHDVQAVFVLSYRCHTAIHSKIIEVSLQGNVLLEDHGPREFFMLPLYIPVNISPRVILQSIWSIHHQHNTFYAKNHQRVPFIGVLL